ncbi:5-deoxy-glucuronate isomerase, partial [Enterococcus faecium]|uniref:5-deoxy-glucuronate isomerase n=1 Tax=Enterococcus faecium TaxID=1352 RepID=UPI0030C887F0
PRKSSLTYTEIIRMNYGGVTPTEKELEITLNKEQGVDYILERRELGVINIGGPGFIEIDGQKEEMKKQDGYYIGKETRHIVFSSQDSEKQAKFYISSVPDNHKYPNVKISIDQVKPMETGEGMTLNERKIYKYIHPNVCECCQ